MFKFKPVSIAFLCILALFIALAFFIGMSWWYCASLIFIYHLIIIWGSFDIRSQFYTEVRCSFDAKKKQVALTFDDGPHAEITPQVLDILEQAKLKATFFCIGKHIPGNEDLIKQIYEAGHTIGLHSHSHAYLYDFYPVKRVVNDVKKNQDLIEAIIGRRPVCFRPPYGVTNPAIAKTVKRMKLNVLGWSVRSLDTMTRDQNNIVKRILGRMLPGSIILLHDHLTTTPEVLHKLILELQKKQFSIVSLEDFFGQEYFYYQSKGEML